MNNHPLLFQRDDGRAEFQWKEVKLLCEFNRRQLLPELLLALAANQARGEQAGPTFAHANAFLGAHSWSSFVAQNPDIFGKGDQYFNK